MTKLIMFIYNRYLLLKINDKNPNKILSNLYKTPLLHNKNNPIIYLPNRQTNLISNSDLLP